MQFFHFFLWISLFKKILLEFYYYFYKIKIKLNLFFIVEYYIWHLVLNFIFWGAFDLAIPNRCNLKTTHTTRPYYARHLHTWEDT
jgi:hypothetical protein